MTGINNSSTGGALGVVERLMQQIPYQYLSVLVALCIFLVVVIKDRRAHLEHLPLLNPNGRFALTNYRSKKDFVFNSKELMRKAGKLYPGRPFRILTDIGEVVILPPDLADEIRNEPRLSFSAAVAIDFHMHIPAFGAATLSSVQEQVLQSIARNQLTKSLSRVTEPLSEETVVALAANFGDSEEWHEVTLKSALLTIVAQLSSRVFLGEELCRNPDWLLITKEYTMTFFIAATLLRLFPKPVRPYIYKLIPQCRKLISQFHQSQQIIWPVVHQRREIRKKAIEAGFPAPDFNDALDWIEGEARERGTEYNPASFQLSLSLAAIHTTADLLEQCLINLAEHPNFVKPITDEIIEVLRAEGWQKTSLHKMKRLDSAIKESQRLKPTSIASMLRRVQQDITLSTGLRLKEGDRVGVDSCRMWSEDYHHDPFKYDPERFLRMRGKPGKEHLAPLVTTSADHLAFGHGEHGCPGRFFAAHLVKIALCHILLKYEWRLAPGTSTEPIMMGFMIDSNPSTKVIIRKKKTQDLDIDLLTRI